MPVLVENNEEQDKPAAEQGTNASEHESSAELPPAEAVVVAGGKEDCCQGRTSHSDTISVASSTSSGKRPGSVATEDVGGCGGEGSTSHSTVFTSLAQFDVLRFRNGFLEVVEELRMRRVIDAENEERIKQLVTKKHELEQKLEEEQGRYSSMIEGHSQQEQDLRKQYEEQLKQAEEDKAKHNLSIDSRERELKALKDEIRALHLAKYTLEKKVQEQDRQLQLQTTSRESHLSQMSQLEQRCSSAFRQASDVNEQMDRLESNVKGAMELNKKLRYVNEHQKCNLEGYQRALERCRSELVEVRVQLGRREGEEVLDSEDQTKMRSTEHELRMQTELNKQLQSQLGSLREEHQGTIHQLKEAHSLIERHVESSIKLTESEMFMHEEVVGMKQEAEELEKQLGLSREKCHSLEEKYTRERGDWEDMYTDIDHRLKALQSDYTALQDSNDKLEEVKQATLRELESYRESNRKGEEQQKAELKQAQQEMEILRETLLKKKEECFESVVKLQEALRQSETLLQEKEKALQDKMEEITALEEKCRNRAPNPFSSDQEDRAQQLASSEEKCPDRNAESSRDGIPSPPKSPFLSPDVFSDSQKSLEHVSPTCTHQIIEEPIDTAVYPIGKHRSPRIHLQKIQLPLTKLKDAEGDTSYTTACGLEVCPTNAKQVNIDDTSDSIMVAPKQGSQESQGSSVHKNKLKVDSQEKEEECKQEMSPLTDTQSSGHNPSLGCKPPAKRCVSDFSNESPQSPKRLKLETLSDNTLSQTQRKSCDKGFPEAKSLSQVSSCKDSLHVSNQKLPGERSQSGTASQQRNLGLSEMMKPIQKTKQISSSAEQPKERNTATAGQMSSSMESEKLELPAPKRAKSEACPSAKEPDHVKQISVSSTDTSVHQRMPDPTSQRTLSSSKKGILVRSKVGKYSSTLGGLSTTAPVDNLPPASQASESQDFTQGLSTNMSHPGEEGLPPTTPTKEGPSLLFSSEDEEEGKDDMLCTQMNRQIDRVQLFLKMDRLRRPKANK